MRWTITILALMSACAAHAQEDEAHRIDRLQTAQLNRAEAAHVQARDRAYARHAASNSDYNADYRAAQQKYQRDMAIWRRRVAACQAGDYSACDQR